MKKNEKKNERHITAMRINDIKKVKNERGNENVIQINVHKE